MIRIAAFNVLGFACVVLPYVAVQMFGDELRAPLERADDAVRVARRVPPLLRPYETSKQDFKSEPLEENF